jgi:hypothetical protein
MVDQRVAAEKQNGLGTPYISPMTRPYTCTLSEHKPVRRGREMIDGPDMRVSNLDNRIGDSAAQRLPIMPKLCARPANPTR